MNSKNTIGQSELLPMQIYLRGITDAAHLDLNSNERDYGPEVRKLCPVFSHCSRRRIVS
jgi:hypothetical protein